MKKAFVLGAGLGTRLRPLTDQWPKPLIPVHHRPLMVRAFEHLRSAGVEGFVVNTHHLPETYATAFPDGTWEGCGVQFRHEPILLETGGGLANVADLLQNGPFFVYNGDVLTDLPLQPAWDAHQAQGNLVTLILRTQAPVRNVAFVAAEGRVLDLRNARGLDHPDQRGFTGLYVVSPAFFRYLVPGKIESVVGGLLRAMEAGERIGGMLADEGQWLDLGDRASYLAAHAAGDARFSKLCALECSGDGPGTPGRTGGPDSRGGCGFLRGTGGSCRSGCRGAGISRLAGRPGGGGGALAGMRGAMR